MTTEHLNIIMDDGTVNPDVWAIGDASSIEGNSLPATAQGTYLDHGMLVIKAALQLQTKKRNICSES
jgi:hypothetical protein